MEEGSKVKAYVFFKGRSILFKEQGEVLLLRFATELEDLCKVDQLPQLEGKKMIMMLSPKKAPQKPAAPAKHKEKGKDATPDVAAKEGEEETKTSEE